MKDQPLPDPTCSAIVPVFNKAGLFRQTADSLTTAASRSGAEVIFVDHGSTDGAREIAMSYPDARVLDHRGGTVASVRNVGARAARGTYLCFLDSDVGIPPDYFDRVAAAFERTSAEAVGYECEMPTGEGWIATTWHSLNAVPGEGPRWYINAANIAVARDAFINVGGWNSALVSAEEVDLCRRLRLAGYQVWAAPELAVVHLDNPKTLAGFFRKQVWHGQGVPATDRRLVPNKVMAMAAGHLSLVTMGTACLFLVPIPVAGRLALAAVGLTAVPGIAWAYRTIQTRRWTNPILSALLFEVYFVARAVALIGIARDKLRRTRPSGSEQNDSSIRNAD